MEISLISDTLSTIATKYAHGLGGLHLSNYVTDRHNSSHDQIRALIAPPTIKPRSAPKKLARKRCRIKISSKSDGGDAFFNEDGGGFFDGGDGPFGGGGGAGGGGFDGLNWDESGSGSGSGSDPAFDFVYEVVSWIVLLNCLHFAFKKVMRILGDHERQKVSFRFNLVVI